MLKAPALEGNREGSRSRGALRAAALTLVLSLAAAAPVAAAPFENEGKSLDQTCPNGRPMAENKARLKELGKRLAAKASLKILAIGSSSTRGFGASTPAHTYPARFEAALKQQFGANVTVTNAGVNGETAEATMSRLEERVTAERFDLVVWQVGTNDAVKGADMETFRAFVERGVKLVQARQTEVVLLDQQFYPSIKDPVRYEHFVKLVETVGEETGVPVLSRYKLMKHWGERAPQDLRTMLASDGFHMSDRGYFCLAGAMVKAVADLVGPQAPGRDQLQPAIASAPRALTRP